jgi:hypothetical protein
VTGSTLRLLTVSVMPQCQTVSVTAGGSPPLHHETVHSHFTYWHHITTSTQPIFSQGIMVMWRAQCMRGCSGLQKCAWLECHVHRTSLGMDAHSAMRQGRPCPVISCTAGRVTTVVCLPTTCRLGRRV